MYNEYKTRVEQYAIPVTRASPRGGQGCGSRMTVLGGILKVVEEALYLGSKESKDALLIRSASSISARNA